MSDRQWYPGMCKFMVSDSVSRTVGKRPCERKPVIPAPSTSEQTSETQAHEKKNMSDNLIPVTSQAWERVKDRLEAQGYRRFAKYVEPADLGLRVVEGAPPDQNASIEEHLNHLISIRDDGFEGAVSVYIGGIRIATIKHWTPIYKGTPTQKAEAYADAIRKTLSGITAWGCRNERGPGVPGCAGWCGGPDCPVSTSKSQEETTLLSGDGTERAAQQEKVNAAQSSISGVVPAGAAPSTPAEQTGETPKPRLCHAHFALHDMECSKGCGDICIAIGPGRVNAALRAAKAELAKLKSAPLYGYGIVDKDWKPQEYSVHSANHADTDKAHANNSPSQHSGAPYRVVELFFKESEGKDG